MPSISGFKLGSPLATAAAAAPCAKIGVLSGEGRNGARAVGHTVIKYRRTGASSLEIGGGKFGEGFWSNSIWNGFILRGRGTRQVLLSCSLALVVVASSDFRSVSLVLIKMIIVCFVHVAEDSPGKKNETVNFWDDDYDGARVRWQFSILMFSPLLVMYVIKIDWRLSSVNVGYWFPQFD